MAGAGTGKTATLVHRVAWLIARGVEPGRILLLTFTRRASAEMLRRVDVLLRQLAGSAGVPPAESSLRSTRVWGGTFHAVATRLLRRYGKAIGLPTEFNVHDRTDSEDLLNVVRTDLNLAKTDKRFPQKGNLHGHLQPLRQFPAKNWATCSRHGSPGARNGKRS